MALNHEAVRVIIYDLDGTLYADTRHFALYARELQSHLPEGVREAFWSDYTAAVEGNHPALRVGTFYDVPRDLVLEVRGGRVERAVRWDGAEVPPELREQLYPGSPEPDHAAVLNVGDLWWVAAAVSYHHGGQSDSHGKAFLRIREIMAAPEFVIQPIPGLSGLMAGLKGHAVQVLVTNSPQPDSEAILGKVGLLGLLDRMYFRANKPAGLSRIIGELCEACGVWPENILSIGDNLANEILPAREMGCQTIFIDPYGVGSSGDADLIVPDWARLFPELERVIGTGRS